MAPGTLLQHMHLISRMRAWPVVSGSSFYEIGSGDGRLSNLFLKNGCSGKGFDLNVAANKANAALNSKAVSQGRYTIHLGDFIKWEGLQPVDFIVSCMVIEHLRANQLEEYIEKSKSLLKEGGRIITLVPANMRAWGVEDEIAGHVKRYSRQCFHEIAANHKMEIVNLSGLTWPLSNLLLPVSNYLVRNAESGMNQKTMEEKTIASGYRNVKFKTNFPIWSRLFINKITLFPWSILQSIGNKLQLKSSLVLYCEMIQKQNNK